MNISNDLRIIHIRSQIHSLFKSWWINAIGRSWSHMTTMFHVMSIAIVATVLANCQLQQILNFIIKGMFKVNLKVKMAYFMHLIMLKPAKKSFQSGQNHTSDTFRWYWSFWPKILGPNSSGWALHRPLWSSKSAISARHRSVWLRLMYWTYSELGDRDANSFTRIKFLCVHRSKFNVLDLIRTFDIIIFVFSLKIWLLDVNQSQSTRDGSRHTYVFSFSSDWSCKTGTACNHCCYKN